MTHADLPLGMQLKALAGWNQLKADWEVFLNNDLQGNFVAEYKGKAVGTTATINYDQKFSWIGMVLVHPDYRNRGIGRALLNHAIAHARPYGAIGLDATAAGAKLYRKLGFQTSSKWIRMSRSPSPLYPKLDTSQAIRLFPAIITYDRQIFGANRAKLLQNIYQRNHQIYFSTQYGQINGYTLSRQGSDALQIGPLIADNEEVAQKLLLQMLNHHSENRFFIDTFIQSKSWIDFLFSCGFKEQRTFSRMYLGKSDWGDLNRQFALAGPEFG